LESYLGLVSLKGVKDWYHVTYDSCNGGLFCVTKLDGSMFKFVESEIWLYYVDTTKQRPKEGVAFLNIVEDKSPRTELKAVWLLYRLENCRIKLVDQVPRIS
jgi:hypothetical protein